jgi:hypothetical protein
MKATILPAVLALLANTVYADAGFAEEELEGRIQAQSDALGLCIDRKLGELMRQPIRGLSSATGYSPDSAIVAPTNASGQPVRLARVTSL